MHRPFPHWIILALLWVCFELPVIEKSAAHNTESVAETGDLTLPREGVDYLYRHVYDLPGHFIVASGSFSPCTEEMLEMWLKFGHFPFPLFYSTAHQDREAYNAESTGRVMGEGGGTGEP